MKKPIVGHELKSIARHVVKFGDGSYLDPSLRYESRVSAQRFAMRWLTWASAKMIAEGAVFEGKGARAVRVVRRQKNNSTEQP
jgi:hypothetical protein